jgi:C-terminal processing protease CtpA/Prc
VNAGIGIALERSELSGVVSVKRISAEGSAAADGRLRPGDVILSVDGVQIAGIGQVTIPSADAF